MPELPEVETVRRSLEPCLVGRAVAGLDTRDFPGVLGDASAEDVSARLIGRAIRALRRRGKYLIVDLDDGDALVIHLRMTGSLTHLPRSAPPERFERLVIAFDDGTDLRFADQRKFGRVLLVSSSAVTDLDARLGPEPLADDFTAAVLVARLVRRSGPIKNALLDQRTVAGLGNIYVDEALFRACLHPLRPANGLSPGEARALHRAIRQVLREGLENRGTSFSSFRDGYGEPGGNQRNLRVYGRGRKGEPCPRCGMALACITVGGRGTHFCTGCQQPSGGG